MPEKGSHPPDSAKLDRPPGGRAILAAVAVASVVLAAGVVAVRSLTAENTGALRVEATDAARKGRWAEAEAVLARMAYPTPDDWLLRAVVATSLNQPDEALQYLSHVPTDGPLAARVALVAGRAEMGRFHARRMEAELCRALEIDPNLAEARRSLVYLYGLQNRARELLEQFAALVDQGPLTIPLVRHWNICGLEETSEPEQIVADLERFVANDPEDRWSRLSLSRVYRRLARLDDAVKCLESLPDSDSEARARRAEVELERGDLDAVSRLLDEGPADHPRLARLRGQLAIKRQDGPAAVRYYRLSDAALPNHGETLYGLALAYRMVDDRAEADTYTRRAEAHRVLRDHLMTMTHDMDPKPVLCCSLAAECEAADRLPEARAWYRLAIAADPLYGPAQEGFHRLSQPKAAPDAGLPSKTP